MHQQIALPVTATGFPITVGGGGAGVGESPLLLVNQEGRGSQIQVFQQLHQQVVVEVVKQVPRSPGNRWTPGGSGGGGGSYNSGTRRNR